jgi:hypothetical protein
MQPNLAMRLLRQVRTISWVVNLCPLKCIADQKKYGNMRAISPSPSPTGAVDPALVLEQIEAHIATVKEEAFSRKDILEKVERWLNACEEEAWLEDYNKVATLVNFICRSLFCFLFTG